MSCTILDRKTDGDGHGYTVCRLRGTYGAMGYAEGSEFAHSIVVFARSFRALLGEAGYERIKRRTVSPSIYVPAHVREEIDGIVAGVRAATGGPAIDAGDIMVMNTAADWGGTQGCRSHSCWGSFVRSPTRTLTTCRADTPDVTPMFPWIEHVVTAMDPSEPGHPRWVRLGFAGTVVAVTAVNEFGTVARLQNSPDSSASEVSGASVLSRAVAHNVTLTSALPPDTSRHTGIGYDALSRHRAWTGGFACHYVPEGQGGIIRHSPAGGFYDLRRPKAAFHGGEVLVCSNQFTDGLSAPVDYPEVEPYYGERGPKSLEDHWNTLSQVDPTLGFQTWSVDYRGRGDMTLWFRGRLTGIRTTPRLALDWTTLFSA